MSTLRELETLAQALAPVFSRAIEQARTDLRGEFERELLLRDLRISELEKAAVPGASIELPAIALSDVLPELKAQVAEFMRAMPEPKAVVVPTADEIAGIFERRFSDLQLSWERHVRDSTERALEKIPVPLNGRDALPLDSFDIQLGDDDRTVVMSIGAGEQQITRTLMLSTVIDKGVFKPDDKYLKGDAVSYGGSLHIARKNAPAGVPGASDDWRLAVKRGRDGRDLRESSSRHDPSKGVSL